MAASVIAEIVFPLFFWAALVVMAWPRAGMRERYLRFIASPYGWILAGFSKRITPAQHYVWLLVLLSFGAVFFTAVVVAVAA